MNPPESDGRTLILCVALLYGVRAGFFVYPTATAPVLLAAVTDLLIPAFMAVDLLLFPHPGGRPT